MIKVEVELSRLLFGNADPAIRCYYVGFRKAWQPTHVLLCKSRHQFLIRFDITLATLRCQPARIEVGGGVKELPFPNEQPLAKIPIDRANGKLRPDRITDNLRRTCRWRNRHSARGGVESNKKLTNTENFLIRAASSVHFDLGGTLKVSRISRTVDLRELTAWSKFSFIDSD